MPTAIREAPLSVGLAPALVLEPLGLPASEEGLEPELELEAPVVEAPAPAPAEVEEPAPPAGAELVGGAAPPIAILLGVQVVEGCGLLWTVRVEVNC